MVQSQNPTTFFKLIKGIDAKGGGIGRVAELGLLQQLVRCITSEQSLALILKSASYFLQQQRKWLLPAGGELSLLLREF